MNKPHKKPTVKELEEHIASLTDALQRERADAENIRRRHDEQIGGLKNMVKANILHDLLPVIDNFERALGHVPKEIAHHDFVKGVQAIVKQFEKTLGDIGIEKIKTVGELFEPKFHEAISVEGEGVHEMVSTELQAGYRLDQTVIRPALVKVTRK